MQGEEPTGIQLDPRHGWDRPLPEKLMLINFIAQLLLGVGYGVGLFFVNTWHPEVTRWLAKHLQIITDPVAQFLPVAIYADKLANPQVGFSATLIRHVFSFLMLVNLVPGVIFFGICKELAAGYRGNLVVVPKKVKTSMYVFLFLGACACLSLFVLPVTKDIFNVPPGGIDAANYVWGCMSPTFLFFSVLQVIAIAWAYRTSYLRGQ